MKYHRFFSLGTGTNCSIPTTLDKAFNSEHRFTVHAHKAQGKEKNLLKLGKAVVTLCWSNDMDFPVLGNCVLSEISSAEKNLPLSPISATAVEYIHLLEMFASCGFKISS